MGKTRKRKRDDDSSDEIPIVCPVYVPEVGGITPGTFVQLISGGPMLTVTAVIGDRINVNGQNYNGQFFTYTNRKRAAFRRFKQIGVQ